VASSGDEAATELLLYKGADIELLDNGADIDAMDPGDDTALHLAADGWPEAVVRVLLENGADFVGVTVTVDREYYAS
jgi:ankyrin repeat protein